MNEPERKHHAGRRKDPFTTKRHMVTCPCGEVFMTQGARTVRCESCRAVWDRIWNRAAYRANRDGLTRQELHARVESAYAKYLAGPRVPIVKVQNVCPFCGAKFVGRETYCARCRHEHYDDVHLATGKTTGWDKQKKTLVSIVSGWRGRPCAGGGAACSIAKSTAALAVDYVRAR